MPPCPISPLLRGRLNVLVSVVLSRRMVALLASEFRITNVSCAAVDGNSLDDDESSVTKTSLNVRDVSDRRLSAKAIQRKLLPLELSLR